MVGDKNGSIGALFCSGLTLNKAGRDGPAQRAWASAGGLGPVLAPAKA
jgi:hypothetical protein